MTKNERLARYEAALRRIYTDYRSGSGLPLHLQAYCMRSEAAAALDPHPGVESSWRKELAAILSGSHVDEKGAENNARQVHYQHAAADDVMRYFAKDFEVKGRVVGTDWFYDPARGVVVFKLTVEESTPPPADAKRP